MHAHYQAAQCGHFAAQVAQQVLTAVRTEAEIDDRDVRRGGGSEFERLARVAGLADHLHVGFGLEQALEAFAHDGVVVDEEEAEHGAIVRQLPFDLILRP